MLSTDCSLICLGSAGVCYVEALGFLPMTRCTDDPMTRLRTRPKCRIVVRGLYELRSWRSDPAICQLLLFSEAVFSSFIHYLSIDCIELLTIKRRLCIDLRFLFA